VHVIILDDLAEQDKHFGTTTGAVSLFLFGGLRGSSGMYRLVGVLDLFIVPMVVCHEWDVVVFTKGRCVCVCVSYDPRGGVCVY
jgi:hypothetical protein